MNALQISRTNQIKEKIQEIGSHYKMTVKCAYDIGKLLTEQKEELEHGEFSNCINEAGLSNGASHRYMKLYEYKITTVGNLSEAYKQIEDLETKKKQKEFAENNRKIEHFESTGVKPTDWDRQTDYQYKKAQEDQEYIQRKKEAFEQREREERERKQRIENMTTAQDDIFDDLKKTFESYEDKINKLSGKSLGSDQNDFLQANIFEAIDKYVLSFSTPSDKIMAGQNIIKHTKEIINSNQVLSVN